MRQVIAKSVVLALVISIASTHSAFAYIDPNTGGVMFQMLAAAFTFFTAIMLFFAVQIRQLVARVKRFIRELRQDVPDEG